MPKELLFLGGMIKIREKGSFEGNNYPSGIDLRPIAKNGVVSIPVFQEMLKALETPKGKAFLSDADSLA